jgi:hypothetical protein
MEQGIKRGYEGFFWEKNIHELIIKDIQKQIIELTRGLNEMDL